MTFYKLEKQTGLGQPWETTLEHLTQEEARDHLQEHAISQPNHVGGYYPQWMSASYGIGGQKVTLRATPEE